MWGADCIRTSIPTEWSFGALGATHTLHVQSLSSRQHEWRYHPWQYHHPCTPVTCIPLCILVPTNGHCQLTFFACLLILSLSMCPVLVLSIHIWAENWQTPVDNIKENPFFSFYLTNDWPTGIFIFCVWARVCVTQVCTLCEWSLACEGSWEMYLTK